MNPKPLFSERQKFSQWWLWLILLGINGVFMYGIYTQVINGRPFGDNPMSDQGLGIGFACVLLLTMLFYILRLETIVTEDGVYVRFFPIALKFRKYGWDEIDKAYVRTYSPLGEYGGWGIKGGFSSNGRALNVSGSEGLQLELKHNTKLLIGTRKPKELTETLARINKGRTF
jgi:hypothetical protein